VDERAKAEAIPGALGGKESVALTLLAPLTGRVVPLDEVPDPVFSGRLLGDGAAIDPTGDLVVAPVAGEVAVLFPTGHALVLRTYQGQEILIHAGIDSVSAGAFCPLVAAGQQVQPGQPLVRLDPAVLREKARSALSPVLIMNPGPDLQVQVVAGGTVVAGRDPLFQVVRKGT